MPTTYIRVLKYYGPPEWLAHCAETRAVKGSHYIAKDKRIVEAHATNIFRDLAIQLLLRLL